MRRLWPYIAIIRDSFHAALSSRILWVAFIAIWLLLGALAPIGYREDFTTTFRDRDIDNGGRLKAMLAAGIADPNQANTPVGKIANALPDDVKRELRKVGQGEDVRFYFTTLADSLNSLLEDESWYDAEVWKSTARLRELRELDELGPDQIDETLRQRRARLRIEAAIPGVFESRSARSIMLTYLGMDFPARFAVDKTQFLILLNQIVVPTIINWLLGFILVFLGILVTASIIPDMLQPGSLHLLLSKPVSRWLLLLSKFVGGCAFVFLCVIQLIVGLYLIAGLRLDVWNARLLLCIPVSVFVFAVFYSVSTLAGLRFRSPILAIGITCMFGAYLVVVGMIGGFFDSFVTRPSSINRMAIAGDQVFATTRGEGLMRWDTKADQWNEIYESEALGRNRVLSPVAIDDSTIVTAVVRGGRFNPFGLGGFDLLVLDEANQWRAHPSLRLPTATQQLAATENKVFAINSSGIAITSKQQIREAVGEPNRSEDADDDSAATESSSGTSSGAPQNSWLQKLASMMGAATTGFQDILPSDVLLSPPRSVGINAAGDTLVLFSGKQLSLLKPSPSPQTGEPAAGEPWHVVTTQTLGEELPRFAFLAISGNAVLLATDDESLQVFDLDSLQPTATVPLPDRLSVVSAIAMGNETRFAVLTSDKRCRMLISNADSKQWTLGDPLPQTDIESIAMDDRSATLMIAHDVDQVDLLDTETLKLRRNLRPRLSTWRQVDRFVIGPLRSITPQTSELGGTIAAIVSGESSFEINRDEFGPVELVRYKILEPVLSCTLFIAVLLTTSCVYFSRRDF
ncbi:putative membrane protein [Rhodopirellula maiorica SM1]|uniref:Putative membrane protein n=1 Tax=Rhodopirellula maiorica SM1 TaxID=1265738 RepID=M5RM84_9BACT|nr:ABC transporter permease [Rhodopirellula maiorica]EMI20286.1 putative membrane protein [Rhodopirellula maiorica SM1]